jgi:hypothetical protein
VHKPVPRATRWQRQYYLTQAQAEIINALLRNTRCAANGRPLFLVPPTRNPVTQRHAGLVIASCSHTANACPRPRSASHRMPPSGLALIPPSHNSPLHVASLHAPAQTPESTSARCRPVLNRCCLTPHSSRTLSLTAGTLRASHSGSLRRALGRLRFRALVHLDRLAHYLSIKVPT